MLENFDAGTIITIVLGVVTTFAGGFWLKAKGKLSKIVKLVFEAYEVVAKIEAALSDNKLTKEEITDLKKELQDVKAAAKDLVSKGQ